MAEDFQRSAVDQELQYQAAVDRCERGFRALERNLSPFIAQIYTANLDAEARGVVWFYFKPNVEKLALSGRNYICAGGERIIVPLIGFVV